jgi:hypothetical protein
MKTTKPVGHTSRERVLYHALELRRLPLPVQLIPPQYRNVKRVYRVGFQAGYRGWRLEYYFRFSAGNAGRREALDAGYCAGGTVLARLLQTKLCSMGRQPSSLSWPSPGADWPNGSGLTRGSGASELTEMDFRRAPLPNYRVPRKCLETPFEASFEVGFEAGYRGWGLQLNSYRRSDFREAWKEGFDAGDAAFKDRLVQWTRSGQYASGFKSGHLTTPMTSARKLSEPDTWNVGYREGRAFAGAAGRQHERHNCSA